MLQILSPRRNRPDGAGGVSPGRDAFLPRAPRSFRTASAVPRGTGRARPGARRPSAARRSGSSWSRRFRRGRIPRRVRSGTGESGSWRVRMRPPMRDRASRTVTRLPARDSSDAAAASPAAPAPITRTSTGSWAISQKIGDPGPARKPDRSALEGILPRGRGVASESAQSCTRSGPDRLHTCSGEPRRFRPGAPSRPGSDHRRMAGRRQRQVSGRDGRPRPGAASARPWAGCDPRPIAPKASEAVAPMADGVIREWLVLGPAPEGVKVDKEVLPDEAGLSLRRRTRRSARPCGRRSVSTPRGWISTRS